LIAAGSAALLVRVLTPPVTRPKLNKMHPESRLPLMEVDTYIEEELIRLNIPGAALVVVEGDKIVHLRGFGRARPHGETPTSRTPFCIGSLTKSVTALAVMQLAEAGVLELDAPVQRYLPWFRVADIQASSSITVRHLLNQTSGMPMLEGMKVLANGDARPNAAELQVRSLSTLNLKRAPGTAFEYSNLNYNILGLIIEACTSESYAQYVQKHIFDPIDMKCSFASITEARKAGLAAGHRYWFGYPVETHNLPIPTGSLSSGQLASTTEDLGNYLITYLNQGRFGDKQVLSPEGIAEMLRPAAEIHEMGMDIGSYAMGWIHEGNEGSAIISHSGIVPDYGAFMALLPGKNLGLALVFNVNHGAIKLTMDEFGMRAAQILAGQPLHRAHFSKGLWLLRGLLLIPLLQLLDIDFTGHTLRRWRKDPQTRPAGLRKWGLHITLPLLPHLLAGISLATLTTKLSGFIRLYAPDFAWMAQLCGSFALFWGFFRTRMVVRTLARPAASHADYGKTGK
jgi:CubicO group peptidase (beta-lactamase class C family)